MRIGPEDFVAAARRCLEMAKRALNPRTKSVLMERARLLRQTAWEFERSLAIQDNLSGLLRSVSTLEDLERELAKLKPSGVLRLRMNSFSELLAGTGDPDIRKTMIFVLARKYNCEMQFHGDDKVWFVKTDHSR